MTNDGWLRRRPVAVLGLGIEGRDLCRFLVQHGARVTAFDTRDRAQVGASVTEIEALGVSVRLGPIDPAAADDFAALYASQSVLLHREPFARRIRELGRPVSSMMREFLHRWPGPTLGVTGSSGKTTTTSLVAAMFAAAGIPHIVGGNIGAGLLGQLEGATPQTWAVLEVSHTQLQLTDRSPKVAVVTNVTPNHLDQFDWNEYVDLKRNVLRFQTPADIAVLNAAEPTCASLRADTPAKAVWFGSKRVSEDAWFVEEGFIQRVAGAGALVLMPVVEIPLRGSHNVENVLAAAAAASAAGVPDDALVRATRGFQPVAHRLEPVAAIDGVQYVNDSIATSPERTLAGMQSFEEPLVLLLGGREKRLPLDELLRQAHARCRAVICFGEASPLLFAAATRLAPTENAAAVVAAGTLAEAVAEARARARAGDVVLLAPACTSFDAYPNFERRGEEFRRLVQTMRSPEEAAPSQR